jgi:hypothetical protein
MNYKINPCIACHKKYADTEININDLNNCFSETVSAFTQYPTNNIVYNDQETNELWNTCMQGKMKQLGRAPCNFQLQPAPVFVQTPHYLPQLLQANPAATKDQLLKACKDKCSGMNKLDCQLSCQTDYDALIELPKPKPQPKPQPRPHPRPSPKPTPTLPIQNVQTKDDPVKNQFNYMLLGWAIIFVIALFVIIRLTRQ